jgi:hypothetical protein
MQSFVKSIKQKKTFEECTPGSLKERNYTNEYHENLAIKEE